MEYTIHLGEDTLKQLDEIVNGGGESGSGGSSDFSTAEVTINNLLKSANNTLVPLTVFVPVDADNFIVGSVSLLTENSTHNVIIGESKAAMLVIDAEGITVGTTGSATYIPEENVVTIEGDCTITIKAEDSN